MLTTEPGNRLRCKCGHEVRDHRAQGPSFCPGSTAADRDPTEACFTEGEWDVREDYSELSQ
jgi:hypothetical protein